MDLGSFFTCLGIIILFEYIFKGYIINSILCLGAAISAIVLAFFVKEPFDQMGWATYMTTLAGVALLFGYIEEFRDGTYEVDFIHLQIHEVTKGGIGRSITVIVVTVIIDWVLQRFAGFKGMLVLPIATIILKIIGIIRCAVTSKA